MSTASEINVLAPMPKTKLGRFRGATGVCIIRYEEQVLYVGWATNIYDTAMRYFGKGRVLESFDVRKATFEVILCTRRKAKVTTKILRHYLSPKLNKAALPPKLNQHEKKRKLRLLNLYRQDSFFEPGEHKSDS